MKKWFGLLLGSIMLVQTVSVPAFTDMPSEEHWSYKALVYATENKILQGFENDTVRAEAGVTRAQAAAIITRIFSGVKTIGYTGFTDVQQSAWYYDAVRTSVEQGFFKGQSETLFVPDAGITRQEIFTVIARAMQLENSDVQVSFADADDISDWAKESVCALFAKGYVKGTNQNEIQPLKKITRAELAQILYNIAEKTKDTTSQNGNEKEENTSDKNDTVTNNLPVTGTHTGGKKPTSSDTKDEENTNTDPKIEVNGGEILVFDIFD